MSEYSDNCRAIDDLLGAYAFALDAQEFEQWAGLFTEECFYGVYSIENVEQGLPLAYMLDDCRERVLDRVKMIREVWAGTIEPYRTRHSIQRTMTMDLGDGLYEVHANFLIGFTQADGTAALLAMGHYQDRVRVTATGALFEEKRAYIDNTPPRYLVYPL